MRLRQQLPAFGIARAVRETEQIRAFVVDGLEQRIGVEDLGLQAVAALF